MIAAAARGGAGRGGIVLPSAPAARARRDVDRLALDDAVEAGRGLGFVSRDPIRATSDPADIRRRPGPRRREPQDRLSVPGPRRVTDAFRAFCTRLALTHWEGLDRLMHAAAAATPAPSAAPDGRPDASAPPPGIADGPTVAATIPMPAAMAAWIDARGRGARYLDAADYVRELVRRDQAGEEAIVSLETALAAAGRGSDDPFDIAAVLRSRRQG